MFKVKEEFLREGFGHIQIEPMSGGLYVIYDLLYFFFSLNRFISKVFRKIFSKFFVYLFRVLDKSSRYITTGHFIEANK